MLPHTYSRTLANLNIYQFLNRLQQSFSESEDVSDQQLFLLLWIHSLSLLADNNNVGESLVVLDSSLGTAGLYSVMALLLGDNWSLLLNFPRTGQRTMHASYISYTLTSYP